MEVSVYKLLLPSHPSLLPLYGIPFFNRCWACWGFPRLSMLLSSVKFIVSTIYHYQNPLLHAECVCYSLSKIKSNHYLYPSISNWYMDYGTIFLLYNFSILAAQFVKLVLRRFLQNQSTVSSWSSQFQKRRPMLNSSILTVTTTDCSLVIDICRQYYRIVSHSFVTQGFSVIWHCVDRNLKISALTVMSRSCV